MAKAGVKHSLNSAYSKWDNLEISDDESEVHPNIDRNSWFRMRHRQRVEREEQEQKEQEALQAANDADKKRIDEIKAAVKGMAEEAAEPLRAELDMLIGNIDKRSERWDFIEKHKKLNVDNICHVVEERTILTDNPNVTPIEDVFPKAAERMKQQQRDADSAMLPSATAGPKESGLVEMEDYSEFVEMYTATMEEYLQCGSWEKSHELLHKNGGVLLHQHSQTYCLLDCLEQEMNRNFDQMKLSSRQSQILSSITEWATTTKKHPRDVVPLFFHRMAGAEAMTAFQTGVTDFIDKIKKRAVDKRKEMQEDEKRERIKNSPGGLDYMEVLEQLPARMKAAFESQDIPLLHQVLAEMDAEDSRKYMDLCIRSGLWNPGADDDGTDQ